MTCMSHKVERICATTAKQKYGLNENDLAEIECIYTRNPYYRSAPQMRLYIEKDIIEISEKKKLRAQYLEKHADEIAAAKKDEKAKEVQAANEIVKEFSKPESMTNKSGTFPLPYDVLKCIFEIIIQEYEPSGVRCCQSLVKDLVNISETCWDFRNVVKDYAIPDFDTKVATLLTDNDTDWEKVLQEPSSLKLPDLKQAARTLNIKVSGTKAELILRILQEFQLTKPSIIPAMLKYRIIQEKYCSHDIVQVLLRRSVETLKTAQREGYISGLVEIFSKAYGSENYASACDVLITNGITSIHDLQVKEKELQEEIEKIIKVKRYAYFVKMRETIPNMCECGQYFARDCANRLCGTCCNKLGHKCYRHGIQ